MFEIWKRVGYCNNVKLLNERLLYTVGYSAEKQTTIILYMIILSIQIMSTPVLTY